MQLILRGAEARSSGLTAGQGRVRSRAAGPGLVPPTLEQGVPGTSVCQMKLGKTSVFLKGIRSRGGASLVFENTEWEGCVPAAAGASLLSGSLVLKERPCEQERSEPRRRGHLHLASCHNSASRSCTF